MDTATFALMIASGSFVIAALSLGWNIWSKFIFPKARVQVGASIMTAIGEHGPIAPPCVTLTATNHGPADVVIHTVIGKSAKSEQDGKTLVINPYNSYPYDLGSSGPFSGGLPKRLVIGEALQLSFPIDVGWFDTHQLQKFGVSDTFGRIHWMKDAMFIELRNDVLKHSEDGQLEKRPALD